MKKKQAQAQKTPTLKLRTETLRRLDDSQLNGAIAGGGRLRVPGGFADDTTPIYEDTP